MSKILLVTRVSGIKDELERRLKVAEQPAKIYRADSTKEAKDYFGDQPYDLAIIDIHAPAELDSSTYAKTTNGLDLVKWMRQEGINTNCVLIRPRPLHAAPELDEEIAGLSRCTVVQQGMRLYEGLLAAIRSFPSADTNRTVEITLWLSTDQSVKGENRYAVRVTGGGSPKTRALQLGPLDMQTLGLLTDHIPLLPEQKSRGWKRSFRQVGRLLQLALKEDADFCADVESALRKIGHPGRYQYAHLRFVIPRELHTIALESIVDLEKLEDEEDDSDLWMLEAPVYRVLASDGVTRIKVGPLFGKAPESPLRCLLIDANLDADTVIETDEPDPDPLRDGEKLTLGHLEFVSEECAKLQDEIEQFSKTAPVLLKREPGEQDFLARVLRHLNQDWDLVHYAGHSYYDENRNKACLFFQAGEEKVEPLTGTKLANNLGSARLLFLSSCESASGGFVFRLAEAGVPAIIGFRWPIEDDLAVEFSECFYKHLLERKSVEEAFFLARVQLHNHRGSERKAWASPVLIEQRLQD